MPNCPHCSEALTGFMTQETLTTRLKGKNDAHKAELELIKQQLTAETTAKAAALELAAAATPWQERAMAAEAQLAAGAQTATLSTAGLDVAYHGHALALWRAVDVVEGEDPLDLASWLAGPARAEGSILAAYLTEASAEAEQPAAQQQPPRQPVTLPTGNTNARPRPTALKQPTAAQIQAEMNKASFQALSREKKEEKIAAWEAQVGI